MKHTPAIGACLLLATLAACSSPRTAEASMPFAEFRGAPEVARMAVSDWVQKGPDAIPELQAGMQTDSAKVKRYCMEALAKITGQWGWDDNLMWQRDVAEAGKLGKPLMVLHLFGNFDEEFC